MMKKTIYSKESEALAFWLKSSREEAGLTVRALGEKLGVHHSIIGKIENGERRIDVIEYVSYCAALNIKTEDGINAVKKRRR